MARGLSRRGVWKSSGLPDSPRSLPFAIQHFPTLDLPLPLHTSHFSLLTSHFSLLTSHFTTPPARRTPILPSIRRSLDSSVQPPCRRAGHFADSERADWTCWRDEGGRRSQGSGGSERDE
jgi:hypothetical protein